MILTIQHVEIEGPGLIGEFFENSKWDLKTVVLEKGDRLPHDLGNITALVILGGPMNVYEEEKYPFLKEEDTLLKKAFDFRIPTLGICLGAQLIVKALGTPVKKARMEEIGWCNVRLTSEGLRDPLFKGLPGSLKVYQWHEDQFDLPTKGVLLAYSKVCNQAFRFGDKIYGLQFHIEVTPDMVENWVKEYPLDDKNLVNDMVIQAHSLKNQIHDQTHKILSNFVQIGF